MDTQDLLIEIGCEELPPKHLQTLSEAFLDGICKGLEQHNIDYRAATPFASPRRLALRVAGVDAQQADQQLERKGPALKAAFDTDGQPTRAAQGFARSCGVDLDQLETRDTPKGKWLYYQAQQVGKSTPSLVADIVQQALDGLPIAKRMRWGDHNHEFVRPVHWLLALWGEDVIDMSVFGIHSDRLSYGHRFHHPQAIAIAHPQDYCKTLERQAHVLPVFSVRRSRIRLLAEDAANEYDGFAVIDVDLLDEVTNLVEWPIAVVGQFDKEFLDIPAEVLIASMQDHQKYFPIEDAEGNLLPYFITISNIDSKQPEAVQTGNERVIRPRLSDAAFFWQQDRTQRLEQRQADLKKVIFQHKLGSVYEKSQRIAQQAAQIAHDLDADAELAQRAAMLCKCDLNTQMVAEFPELQGIMGGYYARYDQEDEQVADAIQQHYQPRFWGDELPESALGQALALADRLDSLVGLFGIGKSPTGDKDPFALRRAALGIVRILLEKQRPLGLSQLIKQAVATYAADFLKADTADQVHAYILDRLRGFYQDNGLPIEIVNAVLACQSDQPLDMQARMVGVQAFIQLPIAENLAAANKRIHNLLKKNSQDLPEQVDVALFEKPAEQTLYDAIQQQSPLVSEQVETQNYVQALQSLAELGDIVDQFFDEVMVMADDQAIRLNRLALLESLRQLFLQVADITHLV